MSGARKSKRPRLSEDGEINNNKGDRAVHEQHAPSKIPEPRAVAVVVVTDDELPTGDELANELGRIDGADAKDRTTGCSSSEEALRAMSNLRRWAKNSNCLDNDCAFLESFLDLGGPRRVLAYLERNTGDAERLAAAAGAVADTIGIPPGDTYYCEDGSIREEIAKTFVKEGAIRALLSASEKHAAGGCNGNKVDDHGEQELIALQNVWWALQNATCFEVDDASKKDQLLSVIDTGLDALTKLSSSASAAAAAAAAAARCHGHNNNGDENEIEIIAPRIVESVFEAMHNSINQACVTPADFDETKKEKTLSRLQEALKNPDGEWNRGSRSLIASLYIFLHLNGV